MSLDDVLMTLGYWLCHQDPGRSLYFGTNPMPLCIRCTGLYLFMGLATWWGLLFPPSKGMRRLVVGVLAAAMGCGLLFAQWLGAQMGFWHSNVTNRLLTGMAAGIGLGWLLHEAFSLSLRNANDKERTSRSSWRMLAAPLGFVLSCALCLYVLFSLPPWPWLGTLMGASSLGGFFTASGWGYAVVLGYLIRNEQGRPRTTVIAAVTASVIVIQAILMALVRL